MTSTARDASLETPLTTKITPRAQASWEPGGSWRSGHQISPGSARTVTRGGLVEVHGTPGQRIATLATEQYGRVARWQLLEVGLTDAMIRTRLVNGVLIAVSAGVYAVGHMAPSRFADELTALLAAPAGTLLSHLTAARLWRFHEPPDPPSQVDILVDDRGGRRRGGVHKHRTNQPHRMTQAFVHDLPVTTPEQTLLDIAPLITRRQLERALDEALALGLTSRHKVSEAARCDVQRPGSADLRALAAARGPLTLTRSQAEERFLALIRKAELPPPEINARLHGFTVDFFWREAGVVVEIDGYRWHSSRSAFERDRRKDAVMRDAGLSLTRLTWEAMDRRPLELVARLAGDLATRTMRH